MNIMKCLICVIDIDKYCIKQEDDEIFAHTHSISIDDVRITINIKKCKSDFY